MSLPDTSGDGTTGCACCFTLTLADVLHILAFVFIFFTLAESTLPLKLWCHGQETGQNGNGSNAAGRRESKRLDRWSFFVLLACYAALSAAAVA